MWTYLPSLSPLFQLRLKNHFKFHSTSIPIEVIRPAYHVLSLFKGGGHMGYSYGYGNSFALIVVLFILLIIVGAAFFGGYPEGVPI